MKNTISILIIILALALNLKAQQINVVAVVRECVGNKHFPDLVMATGPENDKGDY